MRIYIFTEYYPATFKPYFDTQFSQFLRDGHEVTIFAADAQGEALNEAVRTYSLHERTHRYPERLLHVPLFVRESVRRLSRMPAESSRRLSLTRMIPRWKDRITHGIRTLLLPACAPDLCLVHGLTAGTRFPWLGGLYPGVPLVMYYHGGETPLSPRLEDSTARTTFESMDWVVTNTTYSAAHAEARGCPPDKLRVSPVGFRLEEYQPVDPRLYRPGGTLRLLSASRLSPEKGHIFALEAVAQLVESGFTDLQYTIVGSGETRGRLESYIQERGLRAYVRFVGSVTTAELISLVSESDVVLLPSIQVGNWVENQACIVQEAMLMKALVVCSATGGVPESTAPALREFVVSPGDANAIAKAICRIASLPDSALTKLGEQGRSFVEEHYDIEHLNRELLRLAVGERAQPSRNTSAA